MKSDSVSTKKLWQHFVGYMEFLQILVLFLFVHLSDGTTMYHTHITTSSDYDCLYYSHTIDILIPSLLDQLIPYCTRPSIRKTNVSLSDSNYTTFAELKGKNISSATLIHQFIPIDIVEKYEIYLQDASESSLLSSQRVYFCSMHEIGSQCEYYLFNMHSWEFSRIVRSFFSNKDQQYQLSDIVPYYKHLSRIRGPKPLRLD